MNLKTITKNIKSNPKLLFLIDGFGALLSAFLLGVVLVKFESLFGIPVSVLHILAIIPCGFAVYDFICYLWLKRSLSPFLKGIAWANLIYSIISLTMAAFHYQSITILGWTYILIEILIILVLVKLEFKTASSLK